MEVPDISDEIRAMTKTKKKTKKTKKEKPLEEFSKEKND
jgi:hypothetical protein